MKLGIKSLLKNSDLLFTLRIVFIGDKSLNTKLSKI